MAVTTINAGDTLSDSRTTINDNFTAVDLPSGNKTITPTSNNFGLKIDNDGTGNSLYIDTDGNGISINVENNGTESGIYFNQQAVLAASKYALWIYSNAVQVNSGLVFFEQDNASSDQDVVTVQNDGTGDGVFVDQNGDAVAIKVDSESASFAAVQVNGKYPILCTQDITGGYGLKVSRNLGNSSTDLIQLFEEHASESGNVVKIQNAGTGISLYIDQNGTPDASAIRLDGCTGTSTKNPEADAEDGWVKVNIDGTDRYIPWYAAS